MKGISIKEPFASLICLGIKTIETRVRKSSASTTKYRGEILICTSKIVHPFYESYKGFGFPDETFKSTMLNLDFCNLEVKENRSTLKQPVKLIRDLGYAIGTAKLIDVRPMTESDQIAACCDIYPDAMSLIFTEPVLFENPFEIKGRTNGFHLGIFDVKTEDLEIF